MSKQSSSHLIWLDLEMTGLDPERDTIIEIATLVTNANLEILAEGPALAIQHPEPRLQVMDEWNRNQHQKSGLWRRVLSSTTDLQQAERETLAFLGQWTVANRSPLCGNTIGHDRRFLARYMPTLERWLHYRNLDVSTIKELARRWAPELADATRRESAHTALSDIRDSVAELRLYRQNMAALALA
ncbi:MAG: oligoribonuclease [Xanthomonadales bacterium]|nr:oligoribonuclease [Xanthomonadales bacterium]